jgi:hypothetical protein
VQPTWPTTHAAPEAAEWAWYPDLNIVTRRVERSPASIDCVLATEAASVATRVLSASAGALSIDAPFKQGDDLAPTWRTTGRLYGSGPRLARYARVEIEVSAYDASGCELRLRSRCRHLYRWGRRRQRRYFDVAHRSADSIVATIEQIRVPCPSQPDGSPSTAYSGER